MSRSAVVCGIVLGVCLVLGLSGTADKNACPPGQCAAAETPKAEAKKADAKKPATDAAKWRALFDGKTLKDWKAPDFGGQGKVLVKDRTIVMEAGAMMTGATYAGKFPKMNYEVTLEGMRIDGSDFFCTTTFPVGDSFVSMVVGGWGGSLVGISSVDFYDASDNATSRSMDFKNKQWYRFRIRVTKDKIEAWIDNEKMVDLVTKGKKLSIRFECDLCRPFGISTWMTAGAVRDIRVRDLTSAEVKKAAEEAKETESEQ
jgi:hypothetical protein